MRIAHFALAIPIAAAAGGALISGGSNDIRASPAAEHARTKVDRLSIQPATTTTTHARAARVEHRTRSNRPPKPVAQLAAAPRPVDAAAVQPTPAIPAPAVAPAVVRHAPVHPAPKPAQAPRRHTVVRPAHPAAAPAPQSNDQNDDHGDGHGHGGGGQDNGPTVTPPVGPSITLPPPPQPAEDLQKHSGSGHGGAHSQGSDD